MREDNYIYITYIYVGINYCLAPGQRGMSPVADDWLGNMKFRRSTSSGEISILLLTPYSISWIPDLLYFKYDVLLKDIEQRRSY